MMMITVNGEAREVGAATIAELLALEGVDTEAPFVAVAVNEAVVPRAAWTDHPLTAADVVEIVQPVQGG